jgi:hypothetical protein
MKHVVATGVKLLEGLAGKSGLGCQHGRVWFYTSSDDPGNYRHKFANRTRGRFFRLQTESNKTHAASGTAAELL